MNEEAKTPRNIRIRPTAIKGKYDESTELRDLIEGFPLPLRAEGKSNGTLEYHSYTIHP